MMLAIQPVNQHVNEILSQSSPVRIVSPYIRRLMRALVHSLVPLDAASFSFGSIGASRFPALRSLMPQDLTVTALDNSMQTLRR